MDPNANLAEQARILARKDANGKLHNYDRYRLYELRVALRTWIDGGGFEPKWEKYPTATDAWKTWQGAYRTKAVR